MKQKSTPPVISDSNADEISNQEFINRRKFIGRITTANVTRTVVSRQVLGGIGFVAPGDKITLAHIGTDTQGLRELLFQIPERTKGRQLSGLCLFR